MTMSDPAQLIMRKRPHRDFFLARVAGLLEVIALLSMGAMIAGVFGEWHFALDLASHFRIQATVALLVAGVLLWPLNRRCWSVVSLSFGAALALSLLTFLWPGRDIGPGSYRLLTMNVLTSNGRKDLVVDYILRSDPDFILLQETNEEWVEVLNGALADSWPYRKSVDRPDNFGIAIYSKLSWSTCEVVEYSVEIPTPSIRAMFHLPSGDQLRLIATHAVPPMRAGHWESRNSLFAGLAADVRSGIPERTIVAGDLNCTPWSHWSGQLCDGAGLGNSADGRGLNISWMPIPLAVCGLPIDHVLVGDGIRVSDREIGPNVGSDHRPVIADFE